MHAAVMDSDMKYVLTWTPRENDIVFQIEVNNPTSIQENIHIISVLFYFENYFDIK